MKNSLILFSILALTACGTGRTPVLADNSAQLAAISVGPDCPTHPVKGFEGTFKGVLSAVTFQGENQPQQNLVETHTVTGCNSFDFDVHYFNPQTGDETREVKFTAQWDKAKRVFSISGPIIQGQFRVIRSGQFLASFDTNFAGKPAHCEEMMTTLNNGQQVMRSVQCAARGVNGASLGVRNALVSRIP